MKLLILGHARHGKDAFADMLNITFSSSSELALEIFLFDRLNFLRYQQFKKPYETIKEAYEDRVNNRALWHQEIANYNREDKSRLAREILKINDCYVGMRSLVEYNACIKENLFTHILWVNGSERKPPEGTDSFNIMYDPRIMFEIDNNRDLDNLKHQADLINYMIGGYNDTENES